MTNFFDFSDYFAIEENDKTCFLVDNWNKKHTRLVNIGKENKVTEIHLNYSTGYHNFKVTNAKGTGLMQLKGSIGQYTDITGKKSCGKGVLPLEDVLVVPLEYEDVSVNHVFERFGVMFPIARKNAEQYDIFANGNKLKNASGSKVFLHMQLSKTSYIPRIISYREGKVYVTSELDEVIFSADYDTFPELCFIQNADSYASICPSYEEYQVNIWMYQAKKKIGIVYLDENKEVQSYIVEDSLSSLKEQLFFINEHYLIVELHDIKYLYFKGQYIGRISWFQSSTKHPIFLKTDKGFYLGKTFFDKKNFFDLNYLHVEEILDIKGQEYDKKVILRNGPSTYILKYDSKKNEVVE